MDGGKHGFGAVAGMTRFGRGIGGVNCRGARRGESGLQVKPGQGLVDDWTGGDCEGWPPWMWQTWIPGQARNDNGGRE